MLKRFYLSKFNTYVLLGIALLNGLILGLSVWKSTYYFSFMYLKFNVVQLVVALIFCMALFYISYKRIIKKKPDLLLNIVFLFSFSLFLYSLVSINTLVEHLAKRGTFSASNSLYINISLIVFGIILSHFDLPVIDSFKKGYIALRENVLKYLGLLLFVAFAIGYIGLFSQSWIYVVATIPNFVNVYLLKMWISNLRK